MIELINYSCGYENKPVVKGVSIKFEKGNIYTIIGRNGCGKSTLLKGCCGLSKTYEGQILIDDKDLKLLDFKERAKLISYLAQHKDTPLISVKRLVLHGRHPHLGFPRRYTATDYKKVDEVLSLMQIYDLKNQSVHTLSGGQRQRVYMAMLLIQDTPIVLLDEPTTYMDIEHQLELLELAKMLKKQGKVVIMVMHDINQAMQHSDYILIMDKGRIESVDKPKNISVDKISKIFNVKVSAENNLENYLSFSKK